MKAKIYIKYKDGILDPQGKVTGKALESIGISGIKDMTIGKYIELNFNNISKSDASVITEKACKQLLVNPNTQSFTFEINE